MCDAIGDTTSAEHHALKKHVMFLWDPLARSRMYGRLLKYLIIRNCRDAYCIFESKIMNYRDFEICSITSVFIDDCNFQHCTLTNCIIRDSDFEQCTLIDCVVVNCTLRKCDISQCNLAGNVNALEIHIKQQQQMDSYWIPEPIIKEIDTCRLTDCKILNYLVNDCRIENGRMFDCTVVGSTSTDVHLFKTQMVDVLCTDVLTICIDYLMHSSIVHCEITSCIIRATTITGSTMMNHCCTIIADCDIRKCDDAFASNMRAFSDLANSDTSS